MKAVILAVAMATAAAPPSDRYLDVAAVNAILDKSGRPQVEPVFAAKDHWGNGDGSALRQWFGPIGGYFPERAGRNSVSGGVVLDCAVSTAGQLSDCKTLIESPAGWGFGSTTMKMIGDGYLTTTPAKGAKDGDRARILIQFLNNHKLDASAASGARQDVPSISSMPKLQASDYLRRPDGDDMAAEYPAEAFRRRINGGGVLVCTVSSEGLLEQCTVPDEAPKNLGFADAVIRLSKYFKITKVMKDGASTNGMRFVHRILFRFQ